MDYNILALLTLSIGVISISILIGVAWYMIRQRRESRSLGIRVDALGIRVDALGKLVGEQVERSLMLSQGKAANPWVQEIEDAVKVIASTLTDLDLVNRIELLDDKLSSLSESTVKRVLSLDMQIRQGDNRTTSVKQRVDALLNRVNHMQGFTAATEGRVTGVEQAVTQLQRHYTGLSETVVKYVIEFNMKIRQSDERLTDYDQQIEANTKAISSVTCWVDYAHFDQALRGAEDFRDFVDRYVRP